MFSIGDDFKNIMDEVKDACKPKMTDDITKELAEIVRRFRLYTDSNTSATSAFMVRVDAALELYAEPFMTSEKPKMTINLKDYEGKFVVVTLRNEWRIVSNVYTNEGTYDCYPYSIDGKNYSNDGRILSNTESLYDIVDIKLVDEDPEPVITRVEVITDQGRDYVNWNKDNKIITSLQDDGKTLKIFVNKVKEDIDIIKECRQTGRTRYTTKKLLDKVFGEQMTEIEEPEMPITKPLYYDDLTPGDKTRYRVAEIEVSKQWATALSGLIDELGGDSPALWEWEGKTPTPEKVVEYLRENIQYLQQLAADEELEACIEWVSIELNCTDQEHLVPYLREYRRPQPTLKSQALKDFETVRKHSDLLPEILDNIENALKSIPE